MGCSAEKEEEEKKSLAKSTADLHEKIRRDIQINAERAKADTSIKDEKARKKYLDIAELCNEKYTSCIEKCTNSDCENLCLKSLETCEKSLPVELKTLK
jgi:hypothetical protein